MGRSRPLEAQAVASGRPSRAHPAGVRDHAARAGLISILRRDRTVASALVLDDSESMKFSDPYTDETKAVAIAAAEAGDRGREVAGPAAAGNAAARPGQVGAQSDTSKRWAEGASFSLYDLDRRPGRPGRVGPDAHARRDQAEPAVSPLGDALQGVLAAHRGQPVAGIIIATDGRSNTGEDPLRAAEAAVRQNIPIFAIAAGADEGPRNVRLAEIEASPVVFVRDPMTPGRRRRGPRPQGRRGDRRPGTAGQRRRVGTRRQPARRRWARTAFSSGRRSGSSPRSSASTNSAPGRGRRARADAGRQCRDRRGARSSASRSASC